MSPSAVTSVAPQANQQDATSLSSKSQSHFTIPAWVQPDLTRLLRVEHNPGAYTSRSISLVSLPPGAVFARITTATPSTPAYSTVQIGRDSHVELNSDLLYVNHSCRPSLEYDMEKWEVRVSRKLEEGLKAGDELTFFYPSTEWEITQKFECNCGEKECLGKIGGAKEMDLDILKRYWLNEHTVRMLKEEGKW
ncbi:hypothetical protein DM02DRAFT_279777 [Periconia macrospinosa]|uniref:Post-SET domain-containing protein n=1 Tax=Periconia macrospinosa TaxID=97972 RepID=A0A2V1E111_9PLEO|nr:hypothetical protein DM02DRAFT_279777 [Periconia macrospinosa]